MAVFSGYRGVISGARVLNADLAVNGPVEIRALPTNGGIIYVGNVGGTVASNTGIGLSPGEAIRLYFISNLNQLYINGSGGYAVTWVVRRI
jgi:hypothetical protein